MMPSNGPPTPQGVGGPTPPLVSRGSEEEGGKRISSEGFPPRGRKGYSASPVREEEKLPAPNRVGGEGPCHSEGGEESPPAHGIKGECNPPQKRLHTLREGRAETRGEKATRRTHMSRELRMLDPEDKLPPKRARRPTRGMTTDTLIVQAQKAAPSIVCGLVRDFEIWAFYHTLSTKCQFR